jgi:hypothetical protein
MVRLRLHQFETGQRIDVAHRALKINSGTDRDAGGTAENVENPTLATQEGQTT